MGGPVAELLLYGLIAVVVAGQSSFHVPSLLAGLCGTI